MLTDNVTNIMIVDDNKNNRLSFHAIVKKYFENVQVIEADSGLNALSILLREKIDLIFLDVQMPHMDGFETALMIQQRRKIKNIPIVFLTAVYKSEKFYKKAYTVGAVDYLTKPIPPQYLARKIKTYLRLIEITRQRHLQEEFEVNSKKNIIEQPVEKEAEYERKKINYNVHELRTSIKTILKYKQMLEEEASKSGCYACFIHLTGIETESKIVLDLIENLKNNKKATPITLNEEILKSPDEDELETHSLIVK